MHLKQLLAAFFTVSLGNVALAGPDSAEPSGDVAQQAQHQTHSGDAVAAPVLSLSASANAQVKYDEVVLTLSKEAQGTEENSISSQLNKALKAVRDKAQGNEEITVETGRYDVWLEPMTKDNEAQNKVWHGQAEMKIKSRDLSAASSFAAAAAPNMTLSGIDFRLTEELRKKTEAGLREKALNAFMNKAQSSAQALGYRDISVRKITLQDSDGAGSAAPVMLRTMNYAQTDAGNPAVPLESGLSTVTVTVSGEVLLKK